MSSLLTIEIEQLEREAEHLREAIAPLLFQLERCEFRLVRKRLERGLTQCSSRYTAVRYTSPNVAGADDDDDNGSDEHIRDFARGHFDNS